MTTPKPTIATDEQLHELANAVALQAKALADMDPSAVEYYSKVRLIANNVDTLKAWTADRVPHPETATRRAALDAVTAVETRETLGGVT
jgi:hypothetical protein